MNWIKLSEKTPNPNVEVLLKGFNLVNEKITVIGTYNEEEKRFITPPKGWLGRFTHWTYLPEND